ncbi:MAG: hypothetical protein ABS69_11615 [Nitrosomonadales bacterium SCN 54-20]|nr:MAG: hypothetical protein ABS69_11615 [Nitrosomonadales bacterium SCN 54-20]
MFDWLKVKSTLEDARNECQKMRATISKNKLRIEELRMLPLPREELADMVFRHIDEVGSFYPQKLAESLNSHIRTVKPICERKPQIFNCGDILGELRIVTATEHANGTPTPGTIETAVLYLLGDQIKAGVRRAIEEMEYPTIVGPSMPRRLAEIDKLTKENSELQAKVEEIEGGLTDVGVAHTAVQSQKPARKGDTGVYPPFN